MSEEPDDQTETRRLQAELDRMSPDELLSVRDYLLEASGGQPTACPPRSTKIPSWILAVIVLFWLFILAACLIAVISRR